MVSKSARSFMERFGLADMSATRSKHMTRVLHSHSRPLHTPPSLMPADSVSSRVITISNNQRPALLSE